MTEPGKMYLERVEPIREILNLVFLFSRGPILNQVRILGIGETSVLFLIVVFCWDLRYAGKGKGKCVEKGIREMGGLAGVLDFGDILAAGDDAGQNVGFGSTE
jgi:hypothetical protein